MSLVHIQQREIERLSMSLVRALREIEALRDEIRRMHNPGLAQGDNARVRVDVDYRGRRATGYGRISGHALRAVSTDEHSRLLADTAKRCLYDAAKWLAQ